MADNSSTTSSSEEDYLKSSEDESDATSDTSSTADTDELEEEFEELELNEKTDEDYDEKVLLSYRKLLCRRVDLVGDYAGDELFVIEGDSLLLRCFTENELDFHHGFQLLHAVWNVEQFLHQLVKRKCNFHLAFFDSSRDYCVPTGTSDTDAAKYYLARAAIIRHLQAHLQTSQLNIAVHHFDSYDGEQFGQYLNETGVYFIMCHDGAHATQRTGKFINKKQDSLAPDSHSSQRVGLRQMILKFATTGYNVALVNGLEWRDTKVMTMVLERRGRQMETSLRSPSQSKPAAIDFSIEEELSKLGGTRALSERQVLAALVISRLLKSPPSDAGSENWPELCASFLVHEALLAHLPLSARRLSAGAAGSESFMERLNCVAEAVLGNSAWASTITKTTKDCDVADFVDGRLFNQTLRAFDLNSLAPPVRETLDNLTKSVKNLCGISPAAPTKREEEAAKTDGAVTAGLENKSIAVLPFSNSVFDKHLDPVQIKVDNHATADISRSSSKIFQEVTHWHNAKKPIIVKGPPTPQQAKDAKWADKRNQWFMAEMRTYAASLTNAVGKSLDPETIVVGGASKPTSRSASPAISEESDSGKPAKNKPEPKKGGGGKNAKQNAGKQAMMNQIAANKAKKEEATGDKVVNSWHVTCKNLEAERDLRMRYFKARDYAANLQPLWKEQIGAEVDLYLLSVLLTSWVEICRNKEQKRRAGVAALIWSSARNIANGNASLTKTIVSSIELTVKTLGLPSFPIPQVTTDRKLPFAFALPTRAKVDTLSINQSSKDFQLLHAGPYMDRSFDSAPDNRVEFQPDGWQRRVLDGIDANRSLFVVAPTSAGKTFISFYAMRKILESDDDGVLVYVAPTKALVNQIAAEIQARYSKKFKYGGKSVWAIHTRDYRINNPTGCQVLVTVPHVLQIMLLAPSHASSWAPRVKRIIFDEVHSIGQAEDGVVWEQLLLLAPCPIIALSATVGNPQEFNGWLTSTQKAIGQDLTMVQHPHRYSDLRKYYYVPPKKFVFNGLPERATFGSLGLDGTVGFNYIHPVAGLVDRSRRIPEDFSLEPRDCYFLWQAMTKHQTEKFPVPKELDPGPLLPDISRKADILGWEKSLKELLRAWISDPASPYDKVLKELEASFRSTEREPSYVTQEQDGKKPKTQMAISESGEDKLQNTTLALLCRLHEQDALPAILFNYDRHMCEKVCRTVVGQLQKTEAAYKENSPQWQRTLQRWEEWKKIQEKLASKKSKAPKASGKKSKEDREEAEGDKMSKSDQARDDAGADSSFWDNFDPEAPVDGYHFADHKRLQLSELQEYTRQLGRRNIQQWLIDAIKRGVGVHHAGMNRKYRQIVEILFRKGFLRCVVATGTLALGINMPCKTVVFSGDSVFLTALNYRQCAGRAGRRGFDLLGNVVFQGVSRPKVCRLLSSRLPDLNGHFPITTTLVLRLFTLLHESKNAKYAVTAINALLSQPRLYMGGPSFKDQTMHHLRFSIEYLRRQYLLSAEGATLNFAGLVSHLYFTENSSFAFHALLKEGYLHELCANIDKDEKNTLENLMLVMAHLFNRIYCRQADEEYRQKVVKPSSSIVFLPPLPEKAAKILQDHNQQTLDVFRTYVETFVQQHIKEPDTKLPLTGMRAGSEDQTAASNTLNSLPAVKTRSPFVALSGAGDTFDSIHSLCSTTRSGVFLEEAVIPHLGLYPAETDSPLNAWLLDFYKHGDVHTIERANGVRRADIWFLLNDFSLVLATILTSLANFMKLKPGSSDLDMLEVMGNLDAHEEAEDDKQAASESPASNELAVSDPLTNPSGADTTKPIVPKKKAKNVDSWEEVADEEEAIVGAREKAEERAKRFEAEAAEAPAWEKEDKEGLRNVYKALTLLHKEFNVKFRAMWA
ncbi:hypothetical protein MBLNU230_g5440t1 [Neophaeotheca triangularis]